MGFEDRHPAVNLIFFTAVIAGTILFHHPVYLGISVVCALAYSIYRGGRRAAVFDLCVLVCAGVFCLYYSTFHHFGITELGRNPVGNRVTLESVVYGMVLGLTVAGVVMWMSCVYSVFGITELGRNPVGNRVTLESVVYGMVLGLTVAGVVMWMSCVYSVVSSDKVVYLFGRVSPRGALALSVLLRMVPRLKDRAKQLNRARQGVGRGACTGGFFPRVRNGICIFSMLLTWLIETLPMMADAMRSRGSALRGRTAYSIYRFDNWDRAYIIAMFGALTVTGMGVLLHQTNITYDPQIVMNPVTPMSWVFYQYHLRPSDRDEPCHTHVVGILRRVCLAVPDAHGAGDLQPCPLPL